MEEKRGKIGLIEGTDYSGKETQTNLLFDRLRKQGIPCETMSFPRYFTPAGRIVGQCYLGKDRPSPESPPWPGDIAWFGDADKVDPMVACLYYAADRRAALPEINQILDSGKNLIFNRYVESNKAHQGGKKIIGSERAAIIRFIEDLEHGLLELPHTNTTVFLYMPYQVGAELKKTRAGKADKHEENPDHLRRAEQTYLELAEKNEWHKIDCAPDGTLSSLRSKPDIADEVFKHMMKVFSS